MSKQLLIVFLALSFINLNSCANRALLKDDTGKPITKQEVESRKSNKNFILFAIGGGALSFGASFFVGSLLDRGTDNSNQSVLWITTGIGTVAGLAYFAHHGRVRDFNLAVEQIKDDRVKGVAAELDKERLRRESIQKEKDRLLKERQQQEAERKKLLEALKKQKKKKGD